jgi:hypothetical protein
MATQRPRARLSTIATVAIVSSSLALALFGCASRAGGQAAETAQDQLAALEGVDRAQLDVQTTRYGLRVESDVTLYLHLRDGLRVKEGAALATYVIRVLWSISGREPMYISIRVMRHDGVYEDLVPGAKEAGWSAEPEAADQSAMPALMIFPFIGENRRQLGKWPGRVPPHPLTNMFEVTP